MPSRRGDGKGKAGGTACLQQSVTVVIGLSAHAIQGLQANILAGSLFSPVGGVLRRSLESSLVAVRAGMGRRDLDMGAPVSL